MKKITINNKLNINDVAPIVFFSECLEERLFIHGHDSYKVNSLNSQTRAHEVVELSKSIINTGRSIKSLGPAADELLWSLKTDPVVNEHKNKKQILAAAEDIKKLVVSGREKVVNDVQVRARLISRELDGYLDAVEKMLLRKVVDFKDKKDIWLLVGNYIVALLHKGYSLKYIRHNKKYINTLLRREATLNVGKVLVDFFKYFSLPKNKYVVYLKALEYFEIFDFAEIGDVGNFPEINQKSGKWSSFLDQDGDFPKLVKHVVEAFDPFSARDKSINLFETLSSVFEFVSHNGGRYYGGKVIVLDGDDIFIVNEDINPMFQGVDRFDIEATSAEMNIYSKLFSKLGNKSEAALFFSAFKYHKAALDSPNAETRLVNLWAGMEGLLPQPLGDKARIEHYLDMMIPCLIMTYLERKIVYLAKALWHSSLDVRNEINSLQVDGDFFDKVSALIACSEYSNQAKSICDKLGGQPLLRYLIYDAHCHLRSNVDIKAMITSHREKLKWQIVRIYMCRNVVVHNASSMPYLDAVFENLHVYFDVFIKSMIALYVNCTGKTSLEQEIVRVSYIENDYSKALDGGKESCTSGNYKQFLFGTDNSLIKIFSQGNCLPWNNL